MITGPALRVRRADVRRQHQARGAEDEGAARTRPGNRSTTYEVVRDFAILGGTTTNCAGGYRGTHSWLTCEEVVKRSRERQEARLHLRDRRARRRPGAGDPGAAGRPPRARGGARARGDRLHDRGPEQVAGRRCAARSAPRSTGIARSREAAACRCTQTSGPLEALAIKGQPNKDMDLTTSVGASYPVEWVPIPEPDHDDDTDNRRDRVPGFTPNRVQAADRGAAIFSRQEGMWVGRTGEDLLRLHDRRQGGSRPGLGVRAGPRAADADLRVHRARPCSRTPTTS